MTPAAPAPRPRFALLFLVMLTVAAGNTALQSVLPALGRSLDIPDSLVAATFAVSALVWALAAPYWARRSETTGRRAMILAGLYGFIGSLVIAAVMLTAGILGWVSPLIAFISFMAGRVVYGLFGSAAPPATQAIVAEASSREDRTKALTLLSSAFGLGTIVGPALAPFLVLPGVGLAGPAYVFAALGVVVVVLVYRYLPNDAPGAAEREPGGGAASAYPSIGGAPTGASVRAKLEGGKPRDIKLTDGRIWPWLLIGLVIGHAQAMTSQAVGFLVIDRLSLDPLEAQGAIGIVLMTGAIAALLAQWGLIPLLNWGPRRLVLGGCALAAAGAAMTAVAGGLHGIAVSTALASLGFGLIRPGFTAGSSLAVGRELQGAVAGRVTAVNGASFILGPSLGVGLYELWRPLPYWIAAAALLFTLGYAYASKLGLSDGRDGAEEPPG